MKRILCIPLLFWALFGFSNERQIRQAPWQQEVNYEIEVELDDVKHQLIGKIQTVYLNASPDTLLEFYFNAWPNAYQENTAFSDQQLRVGNSDFHFSEDSMRGSMEIKSWEFNSQIVEVIWIQKDIFKVVLPQPILPGEEVIWNGEFQVEIPGPFSRMGHIGQEYQITQWFPKPAVYDVNGWNPMPYLDQGEFYSEFGYFDVSITVPAEYVIGATGNIQEEDEKNWMLQQDSAGAVPHPKAGSKKTVRFTQDKVHDFAWFASKDFAVRMREVEVGGETYEAWVMASDRSESRFNSAMEAIELALKEYGERVSPYPFKTVKVVEGPIEAGGGMEYPTITVVAALGKEVIVHEVGHNWFYGILGTNERRYPWMDESINSYIEFKAIHPELGDLDSADFNTRVMIALAKNEIGNNRGQRVSESSEDLTHLNYGVIIYGKGSILFGYLENYLNSIQDDLFKECMHTYYDAWKFKHPLPGDMKDVFERVSGQDLSWFFDGLLESAAPDWGLSGTIKKPKIKSNVPFNLPLPIQYSFKDGSDTLVWVKSSSDPGSLNRENAQKMLLDPQGLLVENRVGNNSIRKGIFPSIEPIKLGVFTGIDQADRSELYALPLVGYNRLDRWMFGAHFTNKSISRKPVEWWVSPLYSASNQTVNGFYGVNYKSAGTGLEVGVTLRRFTTFFLTRESRYTYNRLLPYVELPWSKEAGSLVSHRVRVEANMQTFQEQFDEDQQFFDNQNPNAPYIGPRTFINLKYIRKNSNPINPSNLEVKLQQGFVNTMIFRPGSSPREIRRVTELDRFTRIEATHSYFFSYGQEKKGLELRSFAGFMIKETDNTFFTNYGFSLSSEAGRWDYELDHLLLDRKATEGMWSQQIMPDGARSKLVSTLVTNARWLASVTATSTIPGKIPLKLFAEATTWDGISNSFLTTDMEPSVVFLGGVQISAFKGAVEVNVPLVRSGVLNAYYEDTFVDFGQQITFVFNLESLSPYRMVKNVKLF
jgi:hypothetical protein